MPAASYQSIFESDKLITKEDLCKILNLDLKRPDLKFEDSEINRAYRRRVLQVHPDKQNVPHGLGLPAEACNLAMNDITKARDCLLRGEHSIPGKAFGANASKDWVDLVISILNSIKNNASNIPSLVTATYWASNPYSMTLLFSTFSGGHLNFRFVGLFADLLHSIQPYAKEIDGTAIAAFLRFLKKQLDSAEGLNMEAIREQLKKALPAGMAMNPKVDLLITTIQETGKALKDMLTDDFINKVQGIIGFWAQFVANLPSWRHITGVYFVSLLFTANSLPKYFNALLDIAKIIKVHKGTGALALVALPMYLIGVAMLPLNIAIHCSFDLALIALKASIQLAINAYKFLFAMKDLVLAENAEQRKAPGFQAFEALVNMTLRISFSVLIQALDTVIFRISNTNQLGFALDGLDTALDSMLAYFRPKLVDQNVNNNNMQLIPLDNVHVESVPELMPKPVEKPGVNPGIFQEQRLHNEADAWLVDLLAVVPQNKEQEELRAVLNS